MESDGIPIPFQGIGMELKSVESEFKGIETK
jgi:hypothetical protein